MHQIKKGFFVLLLLLLPRLGIGAEIQDHAGFITIDPVHFYFEFGSYYARFDFVSSPAKIWYVFQKADENAEQKPLFVFFNGGPGSATSCGLLSLNTGRLALDTSGGVAGSRLVANPDSWTRYGNLLYIDARQTGFSYNLMDNPQDQSQRRLEFNAQNFNTFFDAADFIRVILGIFQKYPQLEKNRVVLVPESYGGTRATVMHYLLLNYKQQYAIMGLGFQDPALAVSLQTHYEKLFPQYQGQIVPPEAIAGQFSHVVMIQPAISYLYQQKAQGEMFEAPGSIIDELAAEQGKTYTRCSQANCDKFDNALTFVEETLGRDIYWCSQPIGYLYTFFDEAATLVNYLANLQLLTGFDPRGIAELYASARAQAYRTIYTTSSPAPSRMIAPYDEPLPKPQAQWQLQSQKKRAGDLATVFGTLHPWDSYFLEGNGNVQWAFYYNIVGRHFLDAATPYDYQLGYMFLENLRYVQTFITNAGKDVLVYAPAIPQTFTRYYPSGFQSLEVDSTPQSGEERPGRIIFTLSGGQKAIVRFPNYLSSGHAVPIGQPADFLADVMAWLTETGVTLSPDSSR